MDWVAILNQSTALTHHFDIMRNTKDTDQTSNAIRRKAWVVDDMEMEIYGERVWFDSIRIVDCVLMLTSEF
ncbi:hypothetical protein BPOR_0192g00020 [Botrytis porri]|uniref:Uncharacterized protein n=1 Tax=Botrytis porri TaxID=87229 RepID=A0A4Z1KTY2_9HELO|nr:hypothetical protein BPOR_0192g00020 [Botrytis porri]